MKHATAYAVSLAALAACATQPPPPELPTDWTRAVAAAAARDSLGPMQESRLAAYAAVAVYEGFAADPKAGLRTQAGQLNGLWRLPAADSKGPVDGAVTASEAARFVIDSLLGPGHDESRRLIDSTAQAHVRARERAGVRKEMKDRSMVHGQALGAAIVAWAAGDGFAAARSRPSRAPVTEQQWWGNLRTFALRNAAECTPDPAAKSQPDSSAPRYQDSLRPVRAAVDAAAAAMHAAVANADAEIARRKEATVPTARRQAAAPSTARPELATCVGSRVLGRLKTAP